MDLTKDIVDSARPWELAWAAGFFDGEGSTGKNKNRSIRVSVGQKTPLLLERFQRVLGCGKIWTYQDKEYTWATTTFRDTHKSLGKLWSYLGLPKREQAHQALSHFLSTRCLTIPIPASPQDDWPTFNSDDIPYPIPASSHLPRWRKIIVLSQSHVPIREITALCQVSDTTVYYARRTFSEGRFSL